MARLRDRVHYAKVGGYDDQDEAFADAYRKTDEAYKKAKNYRSPERVSAERQMENAFADANRAAAKTSRNIQKKYQQVEEKFAKAKQDTANAYAKAGRNPRDESQAGRPGGGYSGSTQKKSSSSRLGNQNVVSITTRSAGGSKTNYYKNDRVQSIATRSAKEEKKEERKPNYGGTAGVKITTRSTKKKGN